MIRGSVDIITTTEIHGWAYAPAQPEPVLVQAVLNHEILGEAPAAIHRADLAAAGFGSGRSGYVIKLRRPVDPLYLPFLIVKIDGGDAELPRMSMLGFAEFFTSFYAAHPAAGRHRSLLGGLWTDRTDAAALRRGKTAIGLLPVEFPALDSFIHTGLAILPPLPALAEPAFRAAPLGQIAALLQTPAVAALLRAILEDIPLPLAPAWLTGDQNFAQPSSRNVSPSPAECLECVLPFADDTVLEIVRNSFSLPEFNPTGASRWTGAAPFGAEHAMLDRYDLPAGAPAFIAPGTIYRLTGAAEAVRCLVIPEHARPFTMAADSPGHETRSGPGPKILELEADRT